VKKRRAVSIVQEKQIRSVFEKRFDLCQVTFIGSLKNLIVALAAAEKGMLLQASATTSTVTRRRISEPKRPPTKWRVFMFTPMGLR